MPGEVSLGRTLAIAGVVHAVLFVGAGRLRTAASAATRTEVTPTFITIERAVDVEAPEAASEVARPESSHRPTEPLVRSTRSVQADGRPPVAPASSALVLPESSQEVASAWTLQLTKGQRADEGTPRGLAVIALDGKNHFMGMRETPEAEKRAADEQANRAAGAAIRDALHDSDVAMGLGGEGR